MNTKLKILYSTAHKLHLSRVKLEQTIKEIESGINVLLMSQTMPFRRTSTESEKIKLHDLKRNHLKKTKTQE